MSPELEAKYPLAAKRWQAVRAFAKAIDEMNLPDDECPWIPTVPRADDPRLEEWCKEHEGGIRNCKDHQLFTGYSCAKGESIIGRFSRWMIPLAKKIVGRAKNENVLDL